MMNLEEALKEALEANKVLRKEIEALKIEIAELREQLNNNSSNSSLPPSQDIKKKPKKRTPKNNKGKSHGGQLGHKGKTRPLAPPEALSAVVECKPVEQCACGGTVKLIKKPALHQVYDIPVPRFEITEYQIYKGCCEECGSRHRGALPQGVSRKGYGARMHALVSLLTSKYRMSKRQVQDWFNDIYQMPVSLGSVSNIEGTSSIALETVHAEIGNMAKKSLVMHADETGHKQKNKNGWAWVLSTMKHTYFMLRQSRGRKIAKELIGSHAGKVIVTDRYSAYGYIPDANHQVCWAHLKRDIQKIAEREGRPGEIGRHLLRIYGKVFGFWKKDLKEKPVFDGKQKRRARYLQNQMRKALLLGAGCEHKKTARTCKKILECEDSLWQFLKIADVPPTNNHAERQLRPLVISKKLTFGTQSQRGSRFIERIFSVVMTCRQQKKDVFNFLKEAISNSFASLPAPTLA